MWRLTFRFLLLSLFGQVLCWSEKSLYPDVKPSSFIYSLSHAQFKKLFLSSYVPKKFYSSENSVLNVASAPEVPLKWDWRDHGVVSAVKNQKSCGGCWAFSTAETVESAYARLTNTPVVNYSVQEILDCDPFSKGCQGGTTCSALQWLSENVTLLAEKDYPLKDKPESCALPRLPSRGLQVLNYTCYKPIKNETELITLIYMYGPLIAAVDANTWNEYMGGIIQYHCGTSLNHAVQLVGYDLTADIPFYIVRNSWGTNWGHNGYAYLKIGANTCGITGDVNAVTKVTAKN